MAEFLLWQDRMKELKTLRAQVLNAILELRIRDPDWLSVIHAALEAEEPPRLRLVWDSSQLDQLEQPSDGMMPTDKPTSGDNILIFNSD